MCVIQTIVVIGEKRTLVSSLVPRVGHILVTMVLVPFFGCTKKIRVLKNVLKRRFTPRTKLPTIL